MLKKYCSVIITPAVCITVFLTLYALYGFAPFGDGLIAWCDMNQQTIPLINTFKDIVSSASGMFQNFAHAGGMDFYGVFFFFLASPFNILTLFVDKLAIPQFMNILVALKLAFAGAAASFFFSKRNQGLSTAIKVLLGISYSFCGYGMLFYQNIIWLDVMCLFPFLLLSMYALLEDGRLLPFSICLAACIIINYYISFMVILFVILFFGIKKLSKKCSRETFLKLGIATFVALLISAVVWIPCLVQYFSSARGESVIDGLISSSFLGHYETSVPVILCGALTLSVVIFAAVSGKLKGKRDKLIILILLLIPLIIEPINMMWHTGNYMSFPARFAFITIFLIAELCAELLEEYPPVKKGGLVISLLSLLISLLCGGFLFWYTNKNIDTLSAYTSTLWGDSNSFEKLLGAFVLTVIAYILLLFFVNRKKLSMRMFSLCAAIIVLCESVCSVGVYCLSADRSFDYPRYEAVHKATQELDDNSFYFVNQEKKYTDANQLGGFGLNTIAHYTSLNSASYMEAAKMLGYSGYWMEINSSGGSLLSNALLGIKYTLTRENDEYCFKENRVFPNAIISDSPFPEAVTGERLTALDNALLCATGKALVKEYDSAEMSADLSILEEGTALHYNISVDEPTAVYVDCYNGFSNALVEPVNDAISVYVNGLCVAASYPTQNENGLLSLGQFENETLTVTLRINKSVEVSSFGVFGIDVNGFYNTCDKIRGLELTQNGGALTGEVTENTPQNVFVGIPYKEGISVKINGEQVAVQKALTGFVSFNTEGITGKLEITYTPKGFTLGVLLTLLGILAAIILAVCKNIKPPKALENAASLLFSALFIVFALAVYIIPIILCLL